MQEMLLFITIVLAIVKIIQSRILKNIIIGLFSKNIVYKLVKILRK